MRALIVVILILLVYTPPAVAGPLRVEAHAHAQSGSGPVHCAGADASVGTRPENATTQPTRLQWVDHDSGIAFSLCHDPVALPGSPVEPPPGTEYVHVADPGWTLLVNLPMEVDGQRCVSLLYRTGPTGVYPARILTGHPSEEWTEIHPFALLAFRDTRCEEGIP